MLKKVIAYNTEAHIPRPFSGHAQILLSFFQACYRGYRVRRILFSALEGARQDIAVGGGYDDDDDNFNYDEEVDLTAFDFNEDGNDWRPADTPQLPER